MIYLDNAATTFPKPASVISEMRRCARSYCGNPGRGSHALSRASAQVIYRCREALAQFFGLEQPENVIFTMNTTYALNMVIRGALQVGDHVLISDMEHNAVYRPVWDLAQKKQITYDVFPTFSAKKDRTTEEILKAIENCITPRTKMLICSHASNICSAVQPIAEIGALCHKHGITFVVDGAQSAGILPIDMQRMQIDALCVPGHKGLYGVQGTGALLMRTALPLTPLIYGGNGIRSLEPFMPDFPPERYESGTLPTPAIAALGEGIKFINTVTSEAIRTHEEGLYRRLREILGNMPHITMYVPHHVGSVLSFTHETIPADDLARYLDERRGICVRSGFHCAALAHRTLQTPAEGSVRVSFSYFTRPDDIEQFAKAIQSAPETM